MKRNTFLKKIDNDDIGQQHETIIDIDHPSPNSKYVFYPSQKNDTIPTIDKNIDKVIMEINKKDSGNVFINDIWKNIPNDIYKKDKKDKKDTKDAKETKETKEQNEQNTQTEMNNIEKKDDLSLSSLSIESKEVKEKEDTEKEAKEKEAKEKEVKEKEEKEVKEDEIVYTEEDLLFNLKIISELNQMDKLSCEDKLFSIDKPDYIQGIYRWWYKEDRVKTLERLNKVIDATFNFMDQTFLMQIKNPQINISDERILYETNSQIIQKFYINLIDASKGLEKLKLTYIIDKSMTTGLNLLIERIRRRNDKINEILKNAF